MKSHNNNHAAETTVCLTCRDKEYTRSENDIIAWLVELAGSYADTPKK